jgi:hypothetical protein
MRMLTVTTKPSPDLPHLREWEATSFLRVKRCGKA